MRALLLTACLITCVVFPAAAQVSITKSATGWELTNGHIRLELTQSSNTVLMKSLRRDGGPEWAVTGTPLVANPDRSGNTFRYSEDAITDLAQGGKQLALRFQSASGGVLSLELKLYPTGAVIQTAIQLENRSQRDLPLDPHIDPLFLTLKNPDGGLKPYSSAKGQHGFRPVAGASPKRDFPDWLVLENQSAGESMLVGGEPGLGVLGWKANVLASASTTVVRAGTILIKDKKSGPPATFELAPGATVETPISFVALAKGDTDNAGNETFRYLKQYVFQAPLPDSPLVTYCIWLTEKNSEVELLKELELAKRVGFDVFYHDATWYEGASVVPGMNDWTQGLGSYKEDKEKFPHGLKSMSDSVHNAGLKFGVWIDPGNVDTSRVDSGEIPVEWLAMIDGKTIGTTHPSLTPTRQLCLGDPKVVAWVEEQLGDIIEKWQLDWIKWDPSSTVSYECNRTDHGHGKTDGAYAAYRGREEILRYLLKRFPNLSGFECDPSLQFARTNAGPQLLLPGGYTNEFITGPMLSPNVWGSLATAGHGDAGGEHLTARWYSASALDYYFRKHFMHGVTFGNINGMSSQFLSAAPPGFVEAFERNLMFFNQYRHLLLEDVYHPKVAANGWSSIQYVKEDATESVVYIFRDHSNIADTTINLRGLDAKAKYKVTSLNDRPGRDRVFTGDALMNGVAAHLPNQWLAVGDGAIKEFADQQNYGSDILLLRQIP
ncbi:MAG TPA: alpha-galactosidase [Terriglobales bacterium]|nr:alpha-galactosidase [Terriglobales bacterium]